MISGYVKNSIGARLKLLTVIAIVTMQCSKGAGIDRNSSSLDSEAVDLTVETSDEEIIDFVQADGSVMIGGVRLTDPGSSCNLTVTALTAGGPIDTANVEFPTASLRIALRDISEYTVLTRTCNDQVTFGFIPPNYAARQEAKVYLSRTAAIATKILMLIYEHAITCDNVAMGIIQDQLISASQLMSLAHSVLLVYRYDRFDDANQIQLDLLSRIYANEINASKISIKGTIGNLAQILSVSSYQTAFNHLETSDGQVVRSYRTGSIGGLDTPYRAILEYAAAKDDYTAVATYANTAEVLRTAGTTIDAADSFEAISTEAKEIIACLRNSATKAFCSYDTPQAPPDIELQTEQIESPSYTTCQSAPSAPKNLNFTQSGDAVTLNWDQPDEIEGCSLLGYSIQVSTDDRATWVRPSARLPNTNQFGPFKIVGGQKYHFHVAARNQKGLGPYSQSLEVLSNTATVPGAPTNLQSSSKDGANLTLAWTAPLSDGGSPITGYVIEYQDMTVSPDNYTWNSLGGGAIEWKTTEWNPSTRAIIEVSESSCESGHKCGFRVRAVKNIGTSPPSNRIDKITFNY